MDNYKQEWIEKLTSEKKPKEEAIKLAKEAIRDREHLNYLDKLNIVRWEKENKAIDKQIESLKG
jgi:predicted translin family RNA/ssDNA-binding protein